MKIGDLEVKVIEKDIKNLHLAVYPPDGRVCLANPKEVSVQTLEIFVISKVSSSKLEAVKKCVEWVACGGDLMMKE